MPSVRTIRVLTYGLDEPLLLTRCRLLAWAGMEADAVITELEAHEMIIRPQSRYGLIVLCHTVPSHERTLIHAVACERDISLYQIECFVEPADFLAKVSELVLTH
jgi:hypothetical protein